MRGRRRILALIAIMTLASLTIGAIAIALLYRTAFDEARARLVETAQSQARLIEAMARFDAEFSVNYPKGPQNATLRQIADAHKNYRGFGETGEFTLARREGDLIIFLLSHRHSDLQNPKPVSFTNQDLAEPMRRALSGMSGTVIGLDYRGAKVLAAHEPVRELGLGIVAKIDLSEVRAPFLRATIIVIAAAVLVVVAGAALHWRVSNPIFVALTERSANLAAAIEQLKQEIAERKAAGAALQKREAQLEVSLNEKNVLLKEVHHRVKNNLQIIASLLNLSSNQAVHPEARDLLLDAQSKVFAMAQIHTQLYQMDRFDEVDMGHHAQDLVDQLALTYKDPGTSIRTIVDAADVRMTLSQAIPCVLVVNELVTNAYKHAFHKRDRGTIRVSMHCDSENWIAIKVKDDGIGIPTDMQMNKTSSLGLELIRGLVRQLKGTVELVQDHGTEAQVRFKSEQNDVTQV